MGYFWDNGSGRGWYSINTNNLNTVPGTPVTALWSKNYNRLDLFTLSKGGYLFTPSVRLEATGLTTWDGWSGSEGPIQPGSPQTAFWNQDETLLTVYCVDAEGRASCVESEGGTGWSLFRHIRADELRLAPGTTLLGGYQSKRSSVPSVVGVTRDGVLCESVWGGDEQHDSRGGRRSDQWQPWKCYTRSLAAGTDFTTNPAMDGKQVFGLGSDNAMYWKMYSWADWQIPPGASVAAVRISMTAAITMSMSLLLILAGQSGRPCIHRGITTKLGGGWLNYTCIWALTSLLHC